MKIKWQGREYHWNLTNRTVYNNDEKQKSDLHLRVRAFLKNKFSGTVRLLEEVYLPGVGLTADFYIPLLRTIVEAHGEQHYKYTYYFHKNIFGFIEQKKRDQLKKDWCIENDITLIELPYSEDEVGWNGRFQ